MSSPLVRSLANNNPEEFGMSTASRGWGFRGQGVRNQGLGVRVRVQRSGVRDQLEAGTFDNWDLIFPN